MQAAHVSSKSTKVMLVDLNNFARYPSMPIGYIAAGLRQAGMTVCVFAPLMVGVQGIVREVRPRRWSLMVSQANHWVATSPSRTLRRWRDRVATLRGSGIHRHEKDVVAAFSQALDSAKPEVVLVSTYLMYRRVCEEIGNLCKLRGVPLLVGGPYFAQEPTVREWARIDGVTAVAAGELDDHLPAIVRAMSSGSDLAGFKGVVMRRDQQSSVGTIAPPLANLDRVAFPDYSDYPWHLYPNRIVPVITGRGCGWGQCTFCSDVTSTAGRTYRSRSPANVLEEIRHHCARHAARRFVFTDLKLNSNLEVWRALHSGMQEAAPGAEWIGAVHVGPEADNGLSLSDMRAAASSGCVRLTTGLETGSQRLSTLMRKGTRVENISNFLHDASTAGISCRCTMVVGHPGEHPEDVHASASFLERHSQVIERVTINRLQLTAGTELHTILRDRTDRFRGVRIVREDAGTAHVEHDHPMIEQASHRRAVMRLLAAAHRINTKELSARAREFEGVM